MRFAENMFYLLFGATSKNAVITVPAAVFKRKSTAQTGHFLIRPPQHRRSPGRIFFLQLAQRHTGVFTLTQRIQRQTELQQIITGFRALGIFLIPFGKNARRRFKLTAHIMRFPQPIARIAGQRMIGMIT